MSAAVRFPEDSLTPDDVAKPVVLRLTVTDADVTAELLRHREEEREAYALAALRLGVMSLRLANGYVDAHAVHEAGQKLLGDLRELLASRGTELTGQLAAALSQYFDATNGTLPQKLRALVEDGGELETFLRRHLGSDESTLARTLAAHLGEGSPIFKMLSPTDATGLQVQLASTIQAALAEQRKLVLREFTLDDKQSALSRFLAEVGASQSPTPKMLFAVLSRLRVRWKSRFNTSIRSRPGARPSRGTARRSASASRR